MWPSWTDLLPGVALVLTWAILHAGMTRGGDGLLPPKVRRRFGTSTGTTFTRVWAHWTAVLFHNSWGHLVYNAVVVLVTMPFAVAAYGPVRTLVLVMVAGPLAWFFVHAALLVPLAQRSEESSWADHRGVGGSPLAFAGAGIALAGTGWGALVVALVIAGYVGYEFVLVFAKLTGGLVPVYHVAALLLGMILASGWGG